MDQVLLAALLIGWAVVLLPRAVRSRRSSDPIATVGGFTQAMSVLRGRPQGREIMVPRHADRIVRYGQQAGGAPRSPQETRRGDLIGRRRAVFVRLLVATGATFLLALGFGGLLWPMFVVTATGLGGYVALLRHFKVERDQARHVVVRAFDDRDGAVEGWQEPARQPVAVGAEGWQVATRDDAPWEAESTVRIRRWDT